MTQLTDTQLLDLIVKNKLEIAPPGHNRPTWRVFPPQVLQEANGRAVGSTVSSNLRAALTLMHSRLVAQALTSPVQSS